VTDVEWALVEPMIPPAKPGGRRRELNVREVLNAIFVLSTGALLQRRDETTIKRGAFAARHLSRFKKWHDDCGPAIPTNVKRA
jgi:transposase